MYGFKNWLIGVLVCLPLIMLASFVGYQWIQLMIKYGPPALILPLITLGGLILSAGLFETVGRKVMLAWTRK